MSQFECKNCGWVGEWHELKTIPQASPIEDDIYFEAVCPACGSKEVNEQELVILKTKGDK